MLELAVEAGPGIVLGLELETALRAHAGYAAANTPAATADDLAEVEQRAAPTKQSAPVEGHGGSERPASVRCTGEEGADPESTNAPSVIGTPPAMTNTSPSGNGGKFGDLRAVVSTFPIVKRRPPQSSALRALP